MLVIRRRAGERIIAGENIEIEILEIHGNSVKLGIIAPESIVITRKEMQLVRELNLTAAKTIEAADVASLATKLAVALS